MKKSKIKRKIIKKTKPKTKKITKTIKKSKTTKTISTTTTIRPSPKSEDISYKCNRCGYKAVKLGSDVKECPLCVICIRCGYTVRRCRCIESE